MRWFTLSSFFLLTACGAAEFQSQKLADGSYTFKCELSMDECVRRAQETCRNQRYRILEGTSETRLRDAPPFERAYHTSRLHIACTDDGANVLLSVGSDPAPAKPKGAEACAVGETRACVGPAACQGGQACLADRSGFGSCDCGPPAPAAPTPAVPDSSEPASSAAPAATGASTPAAPAGTPTP